MDSILKAHFANLKTIIKSSLSSDEYNCFFSELKELYNKSKSDNFNIAIVGEFNSGKSTFINALMRKRILKEAGRPTTAAATFITRSKPHSLWQSFFGTKAYVYLSFDTGQSFIINEGDYKECADYLKNEFRCEVNDIYEIIHIVTADQCVAKHVTRLNIELPCKSLPKNITIIDTPGFNPGEINFENHLRITEEVVAKDADMAIVLMPSQNAMTATLMDFIESNISRYVHRCVFIVTKIDLIPEYERPSVIAYVKTQLKNHGVQQPKVYAISARTVLPVKNISEANRLSWESFQKEFNLIEETLWTNLKQYKAITLREHIYYLLEDLSDKLKALLESNQNKLNSTLRFLKQHSIQRIETLTNAAYARACSSLDRHYSKMPISSDSFCSEAKNSCESIIRKGGKLRNYKNEEAPKINDKITSIAASYLTGIKNCLNKSKIVVEHEIDNFRNEFHSHYKDMPALEPRLDYIPNSDSIKVKTIDLSESDALWNSTAVGRIFRNIGNWFRKESEIQNEVIKEVNKAIDSYFQSLERNASISVEKIQRGQKQSLKIYCDKHVRQYGRIVESLIQKQNKKKEQIECEIKRNNQHLGEIQSLHDKMEKEIHQMATIL